ncbi:MAG: hypothetical protein AAFU83_00515, partial [Bacteroidota bacterium]
CEKSVSLTNFSLVSCLEDLSEKPLSSRRDPIETLFENKSVLEQPGVNHAAKASTVRDTLRMLCVYIL